MEMDVSTIISGIYAITPDQIDNDLLLNHTRQAIEGGVRLVQYRSKTLKPKQKKIQATALKELCDRANVQLIINDDIELSKHLDAFGVHLGKYDDNVDKARKLLGPNKCIGVSCYNSLSRVKEAYEKQVDYIALGAFFPTKTKPNAPRATLDILRQARSMGNIPMVAIGGITLENIETLKNEQINCIALVSSLFNSDNIESTAKQFCTILKSWNP